MLEGNLSKIGRFHTLAQTAGSRCNYTFPDHRRHGWTACGCNSVAQLSRDGNLVEDGSSADHGDSGNSHGVKLGYATSFSVKIIVLKCRDGLLELLCHND